MAFYARKNGLDHFRFAKARQGTSCFICGESIAKGTLRYASGLVSLCTKCAACWEKEGGYLGDISRNKQRADYTTKQEAIEKEQEK
jgi:hypothetical protein